MRSDSIVVPDSEKQAWPDHIPELSFYLSKSRHVTPLTFAVEVAFLVYLFYSFYGCDMEAPRSQEWAKTNIRAMTAWRRKQCVLQ